MSKRSCIAPVHTSATRWSLFILSAVTAMTLMAIYREVIAPNGYNAFELASVPLFGLLTLWISFSFWSCTLGLARVFLSEEEDDEDIAEDREVHVSQARTAVLVPVYNESPTAVFARIRAMVESLAETGEAAHFDFFVLSDTTDPDIWLQEEWTWSQMMQGADLPANVYYRRRQKNSQRKAGNIADFCTRWGRNYDFMIVLDADSLMLGSTLVEMVKRMLRDTRLGILQVPPRPVNRMSLFARLQQFAAAIYSPVCIYGFDAWSCHQGNYWGHNAIIRIHAFMQHCELPVLPGSKPLGGEILSHDFVEAALLTGAGWKVCLAHDLDGSYEECPTTLVDYLKRDQRWSQGNMQHSRLIVSDGFHLLGRLHFLMGVMSYASSPIWFMFLLTSLAGYWYEKTFLPAPSAPTAAVSLVLFSSIMALLLLPKLWSVFALSRSRLSASSFGGWSRAVGSVLLETAVSMLIAPIMAFYHSMFVFTTLSGRSVGWGAQRRDEAAVTFKDAVRDHWPAFTAYAVGGGLTAVLMPELLPWMTPLLAGPLLIFPFAMAAGSRRIGQWLLRRRLLVIPEELQTPQIILTMEAEEERLEAISSRCFWQQLLTADDFRQTHFRILNETSVVHTVSNEELAEAESMVQRGELLTLSRELKKSVLADQDATERLVEAYRKSLTTTP